MQESYKPGEDSNTNTSVLTIPTPFQLLKMLHPAPTTNTLPAPPKPPTSSKTA